MASHLPGQFCQEVLERKNLDTVDALGARTKKHDDSSMNIPGDVGFERAQQR
jgi:hypothetical protein